MNPPKKIVGRGEATSLLASLSEEFAVVRNPEYVFPPYELYPLPPKKTLLDRGMAAAVMDMDGTTTTTEALCLHSLETMVRRLIGADDDPGWPGLDRHRDYPHIIGNSTTKHVEYLVRVYGNRMMADSFSAHFLPAAAWNLANRPERRAEVLSTLIALGMGEGAGERRPVFADETAVVRAAIEVYYQEYHEILGGIAEGKSAEISKRLFGTPNRRLIEPMQGVGYFLALLGGLLGEEAECGYEKLAEPLKSLGFPAGEIEEGRRFLKPLGNYFAANPVAIGLVTSSIEYEANIVLSEVFRILAEEAADWPVSAAVSERIAEGFSDYRNVYGAVITASDSCEIRLKPHRDLYSLALSRLGVLPGDFDRVIGFEDSESGTIAIRAAGIPLGVALPFPETEGHSFETASFVATGGLPEVVLLRHCFLPEKLLSFHS